ncbi:ubiquinone/menaquinone biosynthesis methyltransferase [Desulfothermus okinawensis]
MKIEKNKTTIQSRDYTVARMFSRIAPWYDFLNHFLSLGVDIYWRKKLINLITPSKKGPIFLDLATGTMDVAKEIEKKFGHRGGIILGMDLSFEMLSHGKKKLKNSKIYPVCANAKELPISTSSVDFVTIAFGIRNISPRLDTYSEVLRVLRPGGKFLILEFGSSRNKILFGLYNLYLNHILPKIGQLISKDPLAYTYLSETIKKFPLAQKLQMELLEAGFKDVLYFPLTFGIVNIYVATASN